MAHAVLEPFIATGECTGVHKWTGAEQNITSEFMRRVKFSFSKKTQAWLRQACAMSEKAADIIS
jgi:hypothetical protein